jgi:hypothetical protein
MGICGRREIGLLDEDADRVTLPVLSSELTSSFFEESKLASAILMRRQADSSLHTLPKCPSCPVNNYTGAGIEL